MRRKSWAILVLTILVASALIGCDPPARTILSITEGTVSVMKAGTGSWTEAQKGMSLGEGDVIKTGDESSAEITFSEGSTVELEAGTEMEIASLDIPAGTGPTTITLEQTIGSVIFRVTKIVDPASRYEVETPTGVVAVRGSIMQVYVIEDGTTWVTNLEGDIWASAQGVELQIPQGRQCVIKPGEPPELVMVAAGLHTVGLKADGTVVAVGNNEYGQCDVGDWADITQVAAYFLHTVGLKADGTVVAVGYNEEGQCDVGNWTGITQIAAGVSQTLGVKSDGTVVAAGNNTEGQCDVGNWTDIIQIDTVGGAYTADSPIAIRYPHTVGLKADGTVVAVGNNEFGQCNVGDWADIVQVAAGTGHTVGLRSDGTVVAVGCTGWQHDYGQCDVGTWTEITQVAAGAAHTVGLKADGTVVVTGPNEEGECDVGDWTHITQVAAGFFLTVGVRSDGTVVAVGDNEFGQCNVGDWMLS
jgi:alpha-tubulin suppressor-like RCC1 family protein